MNTIKYISIFAILVLICACSDNNGDTHQLNLHEQLRQYLLEAELGSAISIHFAKKPVIPLQPVEPESKLLTQLTSANAKTRWSAASKLAYSENRGVVMALIDAMNDPGGTQRVCVMAQALGHLKDPRALGALTEAAFDPYNRDLRLCAIRSIGMLGDRRAVPDLIRALEQRNTPLQAANSLARLGDESAVSAIIDASKDPAIRPWMIAALGELGSAKALPYLSTLVGNENKSLDNINTEAIWKIGVLAKSGSGEEKLGHVLQQDPSARHRMWAAFRLGERRRSQDLSVLIGALSDTDERVRGRSAASVVRFGESAASLIRISLNHADAASRHYAAAILAYTGNRTDIRRLEQLKASKMAPPALISESITLLRRKSANRDPTAITLQKSQD